MLDQSDMCVYMTLGGRCVMVAAWVCFSGVLLGYLGDEHKRGSGVLDMKFESPNILLTCGHDTYLRMWDLRMHTWSVLAWSQLFVLKELALSG